MDYKKGYYKLFGALADAIDCIDAGDPQCAKILLVAANQHTERMMMDDADGIAIAFSPRTDGEQGEAK